MYIGYGVYKNIYRKATVFIIAPCGQHLHLAKATAIINCLNYVCIGKVSHLPRYFPKWPEAGCPPPLYIFPA